METPPSLTVEATEPPRQTRSKFLVGVACFCAGLLLTQVNHFIARHDGPAAFELALIAAGWGLAGLSFLYARRHCPQDELEVLIDRQALGFAFYAMMFGLLALEGLQSAGFVDRFAWENNQLVGVLVALMLVGLGVSKLRYR